MPCRLSTSYSISGDCSGGNSGAIYLEIIGEAPGYSISWLYPYTGIVSLGSSTATTITNLSAGTYQFFVLDSCSDPQNSAYTSVYISSGTCSSITGVENTTCGYNNGILTATTQNNYSTVTYDLYDSLTDTIVQTATVPATTYFFNSLSAGTYYVVADDGGGCTGRSESCIIKSSTTLNYDLFAINDANCTGSGGSGAIYVTNLNGVPPYTYVWLTSPAQYTSSITGLTPGVYTVEVTDSTGCMIPKSVEIQKVDTIGISLVTYTNPTCFGSDGTVTVYITGGTGPYFYQGSNGVNSAPIFGQNFTFTGVSVGTFTMTITDAGFCTTSKSISVVTPQAFQIGTITSTNSTCGYSDGKIEISLIGVTAPILVYTISGETIPTQSTITSPASPAFTFPNLESGTYLISISGGTCEYSQLVTIDNDPLLLIDSSYEETTCNRCNGSITLNVSGGSGTYTYSINGVDLIYTDSINIASSSHTFTSLCSGTYVGSITDGTCTVTTNITIPQSNTVQFNLIGTQPTAGLNNGSITGLITNGTPPFTWTWSPNVNGQTGLTVTNLSAGTYELTVVDSNKCSKKRTEILLGFNTVSSYQTFNICDSNFENQGILLIKGIKKMLNEGFYDLTIGENNCILNNSIFTAIVTIDGKTSTETFYQGTSLNDYPSDQLWSDTIKGMVSKYNGITGVTINPLDNTVKISTPCNTLSDANVKVDLTITYDISCEGEPVSPTPTPTPTITPTMTPTPTPTSPPILCLCETCNIGFDFYEQEDIGRLSAGIITGSCDPSISEYHISWYGPDSTTTLAFTSGSGTTFAPYDYEHPFTGVSSIPCLSGVYQPVIDNIVINGLTYSFTGSCSSCLPPITILANDCSTGNVIGEDYTHRIQFSADSGSGVIPLPLNSTFNLTGTTNYFAYKFKGESIPDRLQIYFSGNNYSDLILLEDIVVGGNLTSNNISGTTFPKSASTYGYFSHVLCLTGFSRTVFDKLIFKITPNDNPQTNWDFYCTCLETFDCTQCNVTESPWKIVLSAFTANTLSCDRVQFNIKMSGCSDVNSDIYKYYNKGTYSSFGDLQTQPNDLGNLYYLDNNSTTNTFIFSTGTTICNGRIPINPVTCSSPNTNTIYFEKYLNGGIGEILITGDTLTDLQAYYNSYQQELTFLSTTSNIVPSTSAYSYVALAIPKPIPSNPLTVCGDSVTPTYYYISTGATVTTGVTGSNWSMLITMPPITETPNFTSCEINCDDACNYAKNSVNNSSTGTSNNYIIITNVGSRYTEPFFDIGFVQYINNPIASATTDIKYYSINKYVNETIPSSGITNDLIPSLSSQTCDLSSVMSAITSIYTSPQNPIYIRNLYNYKVVAINPSINLQDVNIYVSPLDSFGIPTGGLFPTVYSDLALTYSGGSITYTNSLYVV